MVKKDLPPQFSGVFCSLSAVLCDLRFGCWLHIDRCQDQSCSGDESCFEDCAKSFLLYLGQYLPSFQVSKIRLEFNIACSRIISKEGTAIKLYCQI